jgi:hypothetical protein
VSWWGGHGLEATMQQWRKPNHRMHLLAAAAPRPQVMRSVCTRTGRALA